MLETIKQQAPVREPGQRIGEGERLQDNILPAQFEVRGRLSG